MKLVPASTHTGTRMHSVYMRNDMKLMPVWPSGAMSPGMKLSIYYHVDLVSCRPDMRKSCLHEVFHAGMTFHADRKRQHEIFMPPRNESFILPRHHVNTTVVHTSTRYENSCRHEFHVGSHVNGLLVG